MTAPPARRPADARLLAAAAVLRRGWRVLLATAVAGAALGAALVAGSTPRYRATTELFAALLARPDESTQLYTQSKVMSYAALVGSEELATRIVRATHLPVSAATVAAELHGSAAGQTLTVTVDDPSRARALTLAQAAGTLLPALVTDLDFADAPTPLIALRLTTPARVSSQPVSPARGRTIVLGTVAGLVLGLAVLAVRAALGDRVRGRDDLGALPVLAGLPEPASPGPSDDADAAARPEAVRQLRTALDFLLPGLPAPVLTLTSPAGGAGVTTLTRELATAFAESGRRVTVLDAHLRHPHEPWAAGPGLAEVLFGGVDLAAATSALPLPGGDAGADRMSEDGVSEDGVSGDGVATGRLAVVPAGAPASGASVSLAFGSGEVKRVLRLLADDADLVLVDAPPVLDTVDTAWVCAQIGAAVLVVPADVATTGQVTAAERALRTVGAEVLGAVLMGVPAPAAARRPFAPAAP